MNQQDEEQAEDRAYDINEPKTKRGKQTLQDLCNAAERVFSEKGYYQTTVRDITSEANIGVGTFYIYFGNKISIYKYLLLQYNQKIRRYIAKSLKSHQIKNRKDAERIGLQSFIELVRMYPYMYRIIWESLFIDQQLFIDYYKSFAEHYIRQLSESQQAGEMNSFDNEIVAYMLMGISNFLGLRYAVFESETPLESVAAETIRVLSTGLFTEDSQPHPKEAEK